MIRLLRAQTHASADSLFSSNPHSTAQSLDYWRARAHPFLLITIVTRLYAAGGVRENHNYSSEHTLFTVKHFKPRDQTPLYYTITALMYPKVVNKPRASAAQIRDKIDIQEVCNEMSQNKKKTTPKTGTRAK